MRIFSNRYRSSLFFCALTMGAVVALPGVAHADENLFGYVKGSETLPKGAWELYQFFTVRSDKGSAWIPKPNSNMASPTDLPLRAL